MKILVVCQYYYPEEFRINEICAQLAKNGHIVTVLTGLPNYPSGKIPRDYKWGRKRKETINNVKVLRSFEIGRNSSAVGMALNYLSFMISASAKALFLEKDYDVVFVYQLSPLSMALPAIIVKKRFGVPLLLYCLDLWPESMKTMLAKDRGFIFKTVKIFSTYVYSKCDTIAVTSKSFVNYFIRNHNIPVDKLVYIPQHAEELEIYQDETPYGDIVNFIFMGNVGITQDIDCILEAAERIKQIPNFRIHFVGDGSYLKQSKKIVRDKGLNEIVVFHGRHQADKMPYFYKIADACLLTLKSGSFTGLTVPSKLQGYMAAGKFVIGAINGAAMELIQDSQCGICINAGDAKDLAELMKGYIMSPEKFQSYGENGRRYYEEHFTIATFLNKLELELKKLAEV